MRRSQKAIVGRTCMYAKTHNTCYITQLEELANQARTCLGLSRSDLKHKALCDRCGEICARFQSDALLCLAVTFALPLPFFKEHWMSLQ